MTHLRGREGMTHSTLPSSLSSQAPMVAAVFVVPGQRLPRRHPTSGPGTQIQETQLSWGSWASVLALGSPQAQDSLEKPVLVSGFQATSTSVPLAYKLRDPHEPPPQF